MSRAASPTAGPVRPARFAAAVEALGQVLAATGPADRVLTGYFRGRRQLGSHDRAFIAEVVFTALRHRRTLAHRAGSEAPEALALAALERLGAARSDVARLGALPPTPAEPLPPPAAWDWPDWLPAALGDAVPPDELPALAAALAEPAPLDLRVQGAPRGRVLARLRAERLDVEPTPYAPDGLRLRGRVALQQHPLFTGGQLEIQDEGSQLAGLLVGAAPGHHVVDFCAGAGGKTLQLAAAVGPTGRVLALDTVARRLDKMPERLARARLMNVEGRVITDENDASLAGVQADAVLVDAPCTGLGTLRRSPDLKWRVTPAAVAESAALQARILAAAARLVRPGGRLVYITCSLLPAEDEAVIAGFLAGHPHFTPLDATGLLRQAGVDLDVGPTLRLFPHRHGTDGFFGVALERRPDARPQ
ncbi:MAG: RsmB/NOP family class I SAM-dependent RNA methyltransferase [Myxococcales bacterium]|nr:RsmB/NOP family class I SAM-dependent RNA methyltransferase [Myxococcales bacterium]